MIETILWLYLGVGVLNALMSARMNAEVRHLIKEKLGPAASLAYIGVGLTQMVLIVWFAIIAGYEQFVLLMIIAVCIAITATVTRGK